MRYGGEVTTVIERSSVPVVKAFKSLNEVELGAFVMLICLPNYSHDVKCVHRVLEVNNDCFFSQENMEMTKTLVVVSQLIKVWISTILSIYIVELALEILLSILRCLKRVQKASYNKAL